MEEATEKQIKFAKQLGIETPEKFSKMALKELIADKVDEKPAAPQKIPSEQSRPTDVNCDVICVKDIFLAMINKLDKHLEVNDAEGAMKTSINLVKQAREGLS